MPAIRPDTVSATRNLRPRCRRPAVTPVSASIRQFVQMGPNTCLKSTSFAAIQATDPSGVSCPSSIVPRQNTLTLLARA